MPSDFALEIKDISKTFRIFSNPGDRVLYSLSGGHWRKPGLHTALSRISFKLHRGETLGIIGRNGAGKTTLLNLLAGIMSPTTGSMVIPARIGTLIALGSGFEPEMSGWNNIRQWGALHQDGVFNSDEEAWISQFTELEDALFRPIKTYSQGMLLRLGFAVATARRPDLLIIDEVMAVGDFFFRRKCHELVTGFVTKGTAAILVSHDYTEILQFCNSAIALDQGQVAFHGDTSTAVNRYLHSTNTSFAEMGNFSENSEVLSPASLPFKWPDESQCVNLTDRSCEFLNGVKFTTFACCDSSLSQRWVFSQGETASFFVSILATRDLQVPIATLIITDERGVIIHGSSSHMKGDQSAVEMRHSQTIHVCFEISLGLRYGEYQVDISVGDCSRDVFLRRHLMTFETLGSYIRQLGRLPRIGVIAVVPRQGGHPTQLTHHGLADLPGTVKTFLQ